VWNFGRNQVYRLQVFADEIVASLGASEWKDLQANVEQLKSLKYSKLFLEKVSKYGEHD